ncbi:hypothetical protein MPTK1_8g18890 [Marchantia polymorpha subsp. ruderalis]|uniref:Bet v I/Major latex protein domain-containing protein n=2 Tax=Marchantia polymorpha TaxID=3197 RepID=A0A176WR03_MARPO|nr:hypothetical protein Mapa_015931 [Marchantia paleacea]OAE34732.1 hypothetical protein AXG93_700s1140 [Marchantia polymorpha subsp. ruderalis]PTQ30016.1 hypothetical protein MARPO_0131s0015 [Marchantia polymorpha]BBN20412.1 hypothetical protein Mp_8g18890 [Marchantia polymorpha subsp. ruderalis]|eukprot:PTQ30016.1 hypothetical protein MARPO_0131s0015 [Marchantia polymorpha]
MPTLSVKKELNVSAERCWAALKDLPNVLPKIMPLFMVSVEMIKGTGGVGSVRVIKIPTGMRIVEYAVARIDLVDEKSKTEVHSIIGGEMREKFYSFYRCTKTFAPHRDGKTSMVTWTVEYEPLTQGKAEASKKAVEAILTQLEHYLMNCDDYITIR